MHDWDNANWGERPVLFWGTRRQGWLSSKGLLRFSPLTGTGIKPYHFPISFYERLRRHGERTDRGLQDIAGDLGISLKQLNRILEGELPPKPSEVRILARKLGDERGSLERAWWRDILAIMDRLHPFAAVTHPAFRRYVRVFRVAMVLMSHEEGKSFEALVAKHEKKRPIVLENLLNGKETRNMGLGAFVWARNLIEAAMDRYGDESFRLIFGDAFDVDDALADVAQTKRRQQSRFHYDRDGSSYLERLTPSRMVAEDLDECPSGAEDAYVRMLHQEFVTALDASLDVHSTGLKKDIFIKEVFGGLTRSELAAETVRTDKRIGQAIAEVGRDLKRLYSSPRLRPELEIFYDKIGEERELVAHNPLIAGAPDPVPGRDHLARIYNAKKPRLGRPPKVLWKNPDHIGRLLGKSDDELEEALRQKLKPLLSPATLDDVRAALQFAIPLFVRRPGLMSRGLYAPVFERDVQYGIRDQIDEYHLKLIRAFLSGGPPGPVLRRIREGSVSLLKHLPVLHGLTKDRNARSSLERLMCEVDQLRNHPEYPGRRIPAYWHNDLWMGFQVGHDFFVSLRGATDVTAARIEVRPSRPVKQYAHVHIENGIVTWKLSERVAWQARWDDPDVINPYRDG